jgi:hypothetical protein
MIITGGRTPIGWAEYASTLKFLRPERVSAEQPGYVGVRDTKHGARQPDPGVHETPSGTRS